MHVYHLLLQNYEEQKLPVPVVITGSVYSGSHSPPSCLVCPQNDPSRLELKKKHALKPSVPKNKRKKTQRSDKNPAGSKAQTTLGLSMRLGL